MISNHYQKQQKFGLVFHFGGVRVFFIQLPPAPPHLRRGGDLFRLCYYLAMTKHVHNLKFFRQVRKDLRKTSTPQERILWSRLRGKNFEYVFKRQQSIGNFIADFYCSKKKLIIEIDGSQHLDNKEYDQERTNYFESLGIKVIRFWNNEVNNNLNGVILKIIEELE
jgi:very-short-patch-repair endonuclease